MTAAVTEFHPFSSSTYWNPVFSKNSMTAVEDDPETGEYRYVQPPLPIEIPTAAPSSPSLLLDLLSDSPLVGLHRQGPVVVKVSTKKSATESLRLSVTNSVQTFFQRAENKLSAETEITAQVALGLLRRIKAIVAKNYPNNVKGCMFAFVDTEDGSTTIEWVRHRSRLGFVLDRDNESSWFIVLSNGESDSGYLYGNDGLKSLSGLLGKFIPAEQ